MQEKKVVVVETCHNVVEDNCFHLKKLARHKHF
jgi:hypothetical protein